MDATRLDATLTLGHFVYRTANLLFALLKRTSNAAAALILLASSFAHAQAANCPFTATGTSKIATIDGLVLARYALNVTAPSLYANVAPGTPSLSNARAQIAANVNRLDVDGDKAFTPNDAMIILRYLMGYSEGKWLSGMTLSTGAIRKTSYDIRDYIEKGCSLLTSATYFVATNGSDTTGDGTIAKPWRTIGFGTAKLASGDTLIVRSGVYDGKANFINTRLTTIANGTAANTTTIMAEQPGSVRVRNRDATAAILPLGYYDNLVLLGPTTNYVRVDGFILDHANSPDSSYTAEIDGNFNKITQTIVRRTGPTDQYGGWFYIGGNDNVLEDCAGVGSARYGFHVGGPTSTAQRNIIRRCVGRVDYSISDQPKATFNFYGNDDDNTNARDMLFQNCIAIDGRKGPNNLNGEATYGAFYFPKVIRGVTVQGSIALNSEAEYAGFFVRELNAFDVKLTDSIAWGGYGNNSIAGLRANASSTGALTFDHVTVGGYANGYYNLDSAPTRVLTNSLFVSNVARTGANDYDWTTKTHNAFLPASQVFGSNPIALSASPLKYLVRAEPGSPIARAGADGRDVGANVMTRYGKSGTRWGELGYDQLTSEALWPWPMEDAIKSVFAEPHLTPVGATPSTNNSVRGFTVATDSFGKPMTLTRYIWQYLGNEIPAEIYGAAQ